MKNMARKSSFLRTFSLGLVLSCMSINVFECVASSSSSPNPAEEDSGASSGSFRPSYLNIQGIENEELVDDVPLLLLEPALEEDRNRLKDEANKSYAAIGRCVKKYMATETAAWVAVKALQTYLADLSGAHYNLLVFYRLNTQTIMELYAANRQAQARITELESERIASSAAPVPTINAEFEQLQIAYQQAQLRIIQLESERATSSAAPVSAVNAELEELRTAYQQAQLRITQLEDENAALRPAAVIELPIITPTTKPFWKRFFEWCGWIKVQDGPNERTKLI